MTFFSNQHECRGVTRAPSSRRRTFVLLSLSLACWVAGVAFSAPLERELGSGLLYVRVHDVPGDLPAKPAGRVPPCIIDVRYVNADTEAAAGFSSWLHQRATPRTPVFVLANADTARAILQVLATHERGKGIAVIGIERGGFRPDIPVKGAPEEERRAYDALEKGAAIGTLLSDNPEKVRNDEASLSKDRLAEASAEAAGDASKPAPPPIDVTLQRAMHLHRALVALRRIER